MVEEEFSNRWLSGLMQGSALPRVACATRWDDGRAQANFALAGKEMLGG